MIPADRRYRDDIHFKALVDTMYAMITRLDSTPTEIREAAMLAQIKYEMDHPRPICVSQDILEAIQARRDERTRNAEQPMTQYMRDELEGMAEGFAEEESQDAGDKND